MATTPFSGSAANYCGYIDDDGKTYLMDASEGLPCNEHGQTPEPTHIAAGVVVVSVACGGDHMMALDASGKVHAWGNNCYGQLGDTTTDDKSVPFVVSYGSLAGRTVVSVSCGEQHTVAVDTCGEVHAWGQNARGQLGVTPVTPRSTPFVVGSGSLVGETVVSVACGAHHTMAVDSGGKVHAWGWSSCGRLGLATVPFIVNGGTLAGKTVVSVACGYGHAMALDTSGTLHAWGFNGFGQLGDTTTVDKSVPFVVDYGSLAHRTHRIASVACGYCLTMAVDTGGTVHSWGDNRHGQLGDGTRVNRSTPSVVSSGSVVGRTIVSVACGRIHTLAVDTSGTLHAWVTRDPRINTLRSS